MRVSHLDIYRFYSGLPGSVRSVIDALYRFVPERLLRSGLTRDFLAELEKTQFFDDASMHEWRLARMRHLLMHAAKHVPWYRGLFAERAFIPEEFFSFEDLASLPILTLLQVKALGNELLPDNIDYSATYISASSGSTGNYLECRRDAEFYDREQAFTLRYRRWLGVKLHWRHAIFYRAIMKHPVKEHTHPPYELYRNRLILSQFHTDDDGLRYYLDLLAAFRPDYLTIFPSTLLVLTRFCARHAVRPFIPKLFICYSENLYEYHRQEVEQFWQCPVYNRYGHSEGCVSAGECEHKRLHLSTELGYVEFLRQDGAPAGVGEPARMVATGFFTHAMPLIRYDTGDIAVLSGESCPCGRQLPVLASIDGRADDIIRTKDGKEIAALRAVFAHTKGIRLTQIVQETHGAIVVRIVPDTDYDESVQQLILDNISRDIGDCLDVRFEVVSDIERSPSGKIRLVKSNVGKV